MASFVRGLFQGRALLFTNTALTSTLFFTADSAEQRVVLGEVDWQRTLRVTSCGLFMGPMGHFFYKALDHFVRGPKSPALVAKKVVVDLCFVPLFECTFITLNSLIQGRTLREGLAEYRSKSLELLKFDVMFWPPVQTINFAFLPTNYRIVYVCTIQFAYNCFLTSVKHDDFGVVKKREEEALTGKGN